MSPCTVKAVWKHASGIALSSVTTITPSAAATVMKGNGLKLCIVRAHTLTETAEYHNKDAFYDELIMLISKIPLQQAVTVGIDADAKMGLEPQSDVLQKWFYPMKQTSDIANRLIDEPYHCIHVQKESTMPLTYVASNNPINARRAAKVEDADS
ncbi:hypothetical protein RB195_025371 [Necator americanus]|uniref:Uncharacterized protein n=1 Tax=Necator americanus TaxID=51031 RepID=A0ABR1ERZ7_NECAM